MKTQHKIVSLTTLKKKLPYLRRSRKKVAFTNGCFDILHQGHIQYLEKAKAKNRILIIGLNSDRSIKRIKGSRRPIVPEKARARVLAALECVDFVVFFSEETPYRLISAIQPDILIKGADWKGKEVVGSDVVTSYGGRVELVTYLKDHSTTNIIKRVMQKCRR